MLSGVTHSLETGHPVLRSTPKTSHSMQAHPTGARTEQCRLPGDTLQSQEEGRKRYHTQYWGKGHWAGPVHQLPPTSALKGGQCSRERPPQEEQGWKCRREAGMLPVSCLLSVCPLICYLSSCLLSIYPVLLSVPLSAIHCLVCCTCSSVLSIHLFFMLHVCLSICFSPLCPVIHLSSVCCLSWLLSVLSTVYLSSAVLFILSAAWLSFCLSSCLLSFCLSSICPVCCVYFLFLSAIHLFFCLMSIRPSILSVVHLSCLIFVCSSV